MRQRILLLGLSACVLTMACGGDDDDDNAEGQGTTDVVGRSSFEVAATDFAFEPAYLRGEPGQRISLRVTNEGGTRHNLSSGASMDSDVEPGSAIEVELTFPASGGVTFFCKYHPATMVGELLVGDAEPGSAANPAGPTPIGGGIADPYGY